MNVVGTSRPIHDARGKAAGRTQYAGDITLPNMACLCLIRSTIPHGRVKQVHTQRALAVPGVYAVFHCFNTTRRRFNRYRFHFSQEELPGEERAFTDYVRFVGDRIGVVAARDQQTAERAARLVEVEYEPLPASFGFDDTLAGQNCLPGEEAVKGEFTMELGQAPEREDLVTVESHSELPRIHHAAMEPHVCVADYDPYQQQLTLYSPNQSVHGVQTVVADLLEMPFHRVRVIKSTMGGSFGGKQEWVTEPVAALTAKLLGRPVKLAYDRGEAMVGSCVRAPMRACVRSRFTPEGELMSLELDVVLDAGAYIGNSIDYAKALYSKLFRCYRIPHIRYHVRVISSNTPVSGAFRGWTSPEAAIMVERNMDEAARQLGIDRVSLRARNVLLPGCCDARTGIPVEEIRVREALLRGRELFRWDDLSREDAAFNAAQPRYRRGVGVGCGGHNSTYYPRFNDYGECGVWMNPDGTVQVSVTLHDHGCGTVTAMKMIVAEELELPLSDIRILEGDTAHTPIDLGCFASRTTYVMGRAVREAARKLRGTLLSQAAQLYGIPEEELYTAQGAVRRRASKEVYCYRDVARAGMVGTLGNLSARAQYHNRSNPGVTGVHFAHVEVDTWTGFTKILDYLALQDVGQAINPGMCAAQVQGAVQMGCGAALREKMVIQKDGRCTDSLSKYHLFLAPDLPDIRVELLTDGQSKEGPYGAKSIGEVCYVPAAPAVCGAVNDALDSSLGVLPLDPDCILTHLANEENRRSKASQTDKE